MRDGRPPPRRSGLLRAVLSLEVLPDPGGVLSFAALAVTVALFLAIRPSRDGAFGGLIALIPGPLRGPALDTALDAVGQAFLLLGPAIALYGGLCALRREPGRILPALSAAGGGLLLVVNGCALLAALLL
jgi:hypothetical protein